MKVKWIILWSLLLSKICAQPVSFTDQTIKLQYVLGTMGQAKCGVDMNGDGLDDITRISDKGIYTDFQQRDGNFLHRFVPLTIQALPIWSITAGDLDNDGLNDLVFGGNTNVSFVIAHQNGEAYTETIMPGYIFSQRAPSLTLIWMVIWTHSFAVMMVNRKPFVTQDRETWNWIWLSLTLPRCLAIIQLYGLTTTMMVVQIST
jgi:hypothetical protein